MDYASRTLTTQEKILETLVNSRTAEAQQLIRQGWDNLKGGFDDDAFVRFEKSLEFDNTVYFTHAELARIYESRSVIDKAEAHHRRAIAFAGGLNEETKGYALVQYAAFLERQKRLDDCIKQARTAVAGAPETTTSAPAGSVDNRKQNSDKSSSNLVGWRFYLAEMLVKSGDVKSGLAELKICIQQDARFFEAAMASSCFMTAQPALSQFLVSLDAEQRAQAIRPLSQCEAPLKALETLAPDKGKKLRARAASIFEKTLPANFTALEKHERDAIALLAEIEAAIPITATDMIAATADLLSSAVKLSDQQPVFGNLETTTIIIVGVASSPVVIIAQSHIYNAVFIIICSIN